jgi:hypothetical protein
VKSSLETFCSKKKEGTLIKQLNDNNIPFQSLNIIIQNINKKETEADQGTIKIRCGIYYYTTTNESHIFQGRHL